MPNVQANTPQKNTAQEVYYYGQGEVFLAEIKNGILGKWFWLVDVAELSTSAEQEKIKHQEAHSGQKATVRDITTSTDVSLTMKLMNRNTNNLEIGLSGKTTIIEAGTVTGEALAGNIENGDIIFLENMGASNLIITDKSAKVLDKSAYEFNEGYGKIKFTNLPTPAPEQPFTAAYEYAKRATNSIMTDSQKNYALMYVGVNLAENGAPCKLYFHKISTAMAKSFSLITSGNELDGMEIEGSVLMDITKPKDGIYGQFGYYEQLT